MNITVTLLFGDTSHSGNAMPLELIFKNVKKYTENVDTYGIIDDSGKIHMFPKQFTYIMQEC